MVYVDNFEMFLESKAFMKEIRKVLNAVGVKYSLKDFKDYYEVKFDVSKDKDDKKYDKYEHASKMICDLLGDKVGEVYSEETGWFKIYKKKK